MKSAGKVIKEVFGLVTVGSLLRQFRANNELTLEELAKKLKITKLQLQKIESGKLRLPLKDVLKLIKRIDEPAALYARVWCEEEVRVAGLEFDDVMKVV